MTLPYPPPRVYPNAAIYGTIDTGETNMTKTLALFLTSAGVITLGGTAVAAGIAVIMVWALSKEDEA
jgi:hypothetical protein